MKVIRIRKTGSYTSHGIGYTEHDGYGGTTGNRLSIQKAIQAEMRNIKTGEHYRLQINGEDKGEYVK